MKTPIEFLDEVIKKLPHPEAQEFHYLVLDLIGCAETNGSDELIARLTRPLIEGASITFKQYVQESLDTEQLEEAMLYDGYVIGIDHDNDKLLLMYGEEIDELIFGSKYMTANSYIAIEYPDAKYEHEIADIKVRLAVEIAAYEILDELELLDD